MKLMQSAVLILLILASACNAKTENPQKLSLEPSRFVTYKTVGDMALKLHVFDPSDDFKKPRPAVVFFHGGGWFGGSPKQFYHQCKYLANQGMVAISAEYRTLSYGGVEPSECVKDGKAAICYVRKHATELGIDPKRIAAGGSSAGGHIAAATGTVKGFEHNNEDMSVSSKPNALILFSPVYDNCSEGYGFDRVKKYWKAFSPRHNITKETPPMVVFFGSKDKYIKMSIAKAVQEEMRGLGIKSELYIYEEQPHGFSNYGVDDNKWFLETMTETHTFLEELGYVSGDPTVKAYLKAQKPQQ